MKLIPALVDVLWLHLESFPRGFSVRICLLGCLLRYLVKTLVFNGTVFE